VPKNFRIFFELTAGRLVEGFRKFFLGWGGLALSGRQPVFLGETSEIGCATKD
jgi:hypothetical protein